MTPAIVSLLGSATGVERRAGLELVAHANPGAMEIVDAVAALLTLHCTGTTTHSRFSLLSKKDVALALQRWGGLRPSSDRLVAVVEPFLDAWDVDVRAAAAAVISRQGVTPRPSIWAPWVGSPCSDESAQRLHALGAVPRSPFDPTAPRPSVEDSWARSGVPSWCGEDATGFKPTMPPLVAFFTRQIEWTKGSTFGTQDTDFPGRSLTIGGASEHLDWLERKKRRLLYAIARCNMQGLYCLDLLDERRDPPVWKVDHEGGTSPWRKWPSLSQWLYWITGPAASSPTTSVAR